MPPEIAAPDHHAAARVRARHAHRRAHRLRARLEELHALGARHHVAESFGDFHLEHVRKTGHSPLRDGVEHARVIFGSP